MTKSKITKRRRRKCKLSENESREVRRRVRVGQLRRLLLDRCGPVLPDDDAGREYLKQLLLPISLGPYEAGRGQGRVQIWGPTDKMRREIEIRAPWMSENEARDLRLEINDIPRWERWLSQEALGKELNVTFAERERLKLWGIDPCDMTKAAMARIRKQKKRLRNKRRYTKSRAEYLAASLSQTKPWEQDGISRRTWERRRVASQSQVNLRKVRLGLASKEELGSKADSCVRPSTATPPERTGTYVIGLTAGSSQWRAA
jgi:hypothetical protein